MPAAWRGCGRPWGLGGGRWLGLCPSGAWAILQGMGVHADEGLIMIRTARVNEGLRRRCAPNGVGTGGCEPHQPAHLVAGEAS